MIAMATIMMIVGMLNDAGGGNNDDGDEDEDDDDDSDDGGKRKLTCFDITQNISPLMICSSTPTYIVSVVIFLLVTWTQAKKVLKLRACHTDDLRQIRRG